MKKMKSLFLKSIQMSNQPNEMVKHQVRKRWILLGVVLILGLSSILVYLYQPDLHALFDPKVSKAELLNLVRSHGIDAAVVLVSLTIICCMVPGVPTSMLGILIGLCYGPFFGGVLNIVGNTSGNFLAITLLNKVPLIHKNQTQNHWIKHLSSLKHPKTGLTISYMIPFIPSILVSYTIQQLRMTKKEQGSIVLFGALPASILYACGGDALFKGNIKLGIIFSVIVILFSGLILFLKKDQKKRVK